MWRGRSATGPTSTPAAARRRGLLRVLVFMLMAAAPAQAASPAVRNLEGEIQAVMRTWGVPGAAIAVVKDGKIVFVKGYGVRQVGRGEPVDADTIFGVGSISKTFTALDVAILADRGQIDWDAPMTRYLPGLRYADPWTTAHATVRTVVAHRTGVDSDLTWMMRSDTTADTVRRTAAVPASVPYGDFLYSNTGYASLGEVVRAASGKSWEAFTRDEVFGPLGMTRSNASIEELGLLTPLAGCWLCDTPAGARIGLDATTTDANLAVPHGLAEDGHDQTPDGGRMAQAWPWRHLASVAPAGSVNSTARDLARYLVFQMGDGRAGGRQVVSAATLSTLHAPATVRARKRAKDAFEERISFTGYGLGWNVIRYRGHDVVGHAGGMPGYAAQIWMSPADRVGVVVLTNLDYRYSAAYRALTELVLGAYLGLPSLDESAYLAKRWTPAIEGHQVPAPVSPSPAPNAAVLRALPGSYRNDALGDVRIVVEGDRLQARFADDCVADLLPTAAPQTFVAVFRDSYRWRTILTADLDPSASRARLTLGPWGADLNPYQFDRVAP